MAEGWRGEVFKFQRYRERADAYKNSMDLELAALGALGTDRFEQVFGSTSYVEMLVDSYLGTAVVCSCVRAVELVWIAFLLVLKVPFHCASCIVVLIPSLSLLNSLSLSLS
jgi:hypothetical protein